MLEVGKLSHREAKGLEGVPRPGPVCNRQSLGPLDASQRARVRPSFTQGLHRAACEIQGLMEF